MSKEKIEWGWVAGFGVLTLYGIWTFFVSKRKIPFFDLQHQWSFFYFESIPGLFGVSLLTFILTAALAAIGIGMLSIVYFSSKETYKAGKHGVNIVKEKIKIKLKNGKEDKTKENKNQKSKPDLGEEFRNL